MPEPLNCDKQETRTPSREHRRLRHLTAHLRPTSVRKSREQGAIAPRVSSAIGIIIIIIIIIVRT